MMVRKKKICCLPWCQYYLAMQTYFKKQPGVRADYQMYRSTMGCCLPTLSAVAVSLVHYGLSSKQHPLPLTKSKSQNNLSTSTWSLNCQEKCSPSQHWMKQSFTHTEKRQSKSSSSSRCWPHSQRASPSRATPLVLLQNQGPHPLPAGDSYTSGLARCLMIHILKPKEHTLN